MFTVRTAVRYAVSQEVSMGLSWSNQLRPIVNLTPLEKCENHFSHQVHVRFCEFLFFIP